MGLKEILSKKLTPELWTQFEDALGDDFDFDMVPRSRLNKVIKQRNELKVQLASSTQIDDDDDDDVKGAAGKSTKPTEPDVATLKAQHTKALADLKIQYAALDKLRAANAIDPDLILKSGLLDYTKITLDDKGALTGVDDQITELTKNKGFLFQVANAGGAKGTGKGTGEDGAGGTEQDDALDSKLNSVFAGFGITPATK